MKKIIVMVLFLSFLVVGLVKADERCDNAIKLLKSSRDHTEIEDGELGSLSVKSIIIDNNLFILSLSSVANGYELIRVNKLIHKYMPIFHIKDEKTTLFIVLDNTCVRSEDWH